jgi:hypothetical protein
MKEADFCIRTEHDTVLSLRAAVLIYRGSQGNAFATVHEIAEIDGGRLLTLATALDVDHGAQDALPDLYLEQIPLRLK